MAHKRFTDIDKWRDEWFLELDRDDKLAWLYLLDNCTNAGRWKKSLKHLNFCCDTSFGNGDLLSIFNGRIIDKDTYLFIPKFLIFQYPNGLNSQKKALIAVVKELREYGLIDTIIELYGKDFLSISYQSTIHQGCVQEKETETDKEKDKDKDKDKEKDKKRDFEMIWSVYPRKLGKEKAYKHFKAQVKTTKDLEDIKKAVFNFELSTTGEDMQFVKHGSTWFNKDWKDWIDYKENFNGKTKHSPGNSKFKQTEGIYSADKIIAE